MYTIEGIRQAIAEPRLIMQEANRLYYRRLRTWPYNKTGIDVPQADWDNLMILDACRYDSFERLADLPGETKSVQSRGSSTIEFLRGNFDGRSLLDTVYVTASPMLHRHRKTVDVEFHEVINVWEDEGWNDQYRTVLPETLARATLDAAERFPNKRLLVHFMQPHYPFIGPTGQEHFDLDRLDFQWKAATVGELGVADEIVRRAYEENLEEVLPSIKHLLSELGGKTVITADHGQMMGERMSPIPIRGYGHPPGIYTDELVSVPWHEFEKSPRREIIADEPVATSDRGDESDVLQERLRDLGYTE